MHLIQKIYIYFVHLSKPILIIFAHAQTVILYIPIKSKINTSFFCILPDKMQKKEQPVDLLFFQEKVFFTMGVAKNL